MATITEFLLARIAEDEEAARLATQGTPSGDGYGPWRESYDDGPTVTVFDYPADRTIVRVEDSSDQEHIIRWHPARVLAECEAKRRIVYYLRADSKGPAPLVRTDAILRDLALPYAAHPDYLDGWCT